MNLSETPVTLFGPYGSRLAEIEEHHTNGISNPQAILNGSAFRQAVHGVALEHLSSGADVGMTHTFGLRSLIHKPGELGTYRDALKTHRDILRSAMVSTGRKVKEVLSFGPATDCYKPDPGFSVNEARDFHETQVHEAKVLQVDGAWFETVNTAAEAVGIALAARKHKVPCVISFVLNKEGRLLSGEKVADAVAAVDSASGGYPLGYSLNCCPIEALEPALQSCGGLASRVIAVYPNASSRLQTELEKNPEGAGLRSPQDTANYLHYLSKRWKLPIIGGCCGYNFRDVALVTAAVKQGLYNARLPVTDVN